MTAMNMSVSMVCENGTCEWFDKVRTVSLQHIGQNIYIDAPLICECGEGLLEVR